LVKLVEDIDCPHCKKPFTKETDLDKLSHVENITPNNSTLSATTQVLEQKPKEPEKVIETKTISPSDKPFFVCANGNCDEGVHRNDNYSKKPNKKCKNCDSLNGDKKCTNCGNKDEEEFDELEDEELTELGIPMPPENHEGHNHE